jgi:hypothetical protein
MPVCWHFGFIDVPAVYLTGSPGPVPPEEVPPVAQKPQEKPGRHLEPGAPPWPSSGQVGPVFGHGNSQLSATQVDAQASPGLQDASQAVRVVYGPDADAALKSSYFEHVGETLACAPGADPTSRRHAQNSATRILARCASLVRVSA